MTLRTLTWIAVLARLANMTAAAEDWPAEKWPTAEPADAGLDAARLTEARDYALTGGGAGYVTRGGASI